ncbi:lipase family protein [Streptomyces guryensis]|uniref:Lipase family protein n=1 Tax=Streptomyces guryensis TaxID=2886947 RepID=A0A9Q3ZBL7_9ACTN|nr:lipase family protein [Streptomyces guryensis]MCD9876510.1 lipase family protein [Streptomyces guryensis]
MIPAETGQDTRRAYCDAGTATQWTSYAGDHLLGAPQAIGDSVNWLTDRFAGKPMPGNR